MAEPEDTAGTSSQWMMKHNGTQQPNNTSQVGDVIFTQPCSISDNRLKKGDKASSSTKADSLTDDVSSSSRAAKVKNDLLSDDHTSSPSDSSDHVNELSYGRDSGHTAGAQNNTEDQTLDSNSQPKDSNTADQDSLPHHVSTQKHTEDQTLDSNSQTKKQASPSSDSEYQKNDKASEAPGSSPSGRLDQKNNKDTDESPEASALLDVAVFKIKVDWKGAFPERWKSSLQKALQSWLSSQGGTASVHRIKIMADQSWAEVQITPSTALEILKKETTIHLKFKDKEKKVTAQIDLKDAHCKTVAQTSMLEENGAPALKVDSSLPVNIAAAGQSASNIAVNECDKAPKMTPETPAPFILPLHLSWYLYNAFSKEMENIGKEHGVTIGAEVSISIKPDKSSSPDSVNKASEDFQKLVEGCMNASFSSVTINHNDMDSDFVKEAIHAIKSNKTKLMFTLTDSNGLFLGPKKFTDMIERETTGVESQLKYKSNVDSISPQSRPTLDMNTKDLPTELQMNKIHWDLMKLSYEEQISQFETKYGVAFDDEKLPQNVIKVQARSKGDQHVNLESHAVRALAQLYQKLASAAVTCALTNPRDEPDVAPIVEKLQQRYCVVTATDHLRPLRLVGLPEDLGPAIADIEKTLGKNVFDDRMKKRIGYSEDIPHARGIKRNQIPDYGAGAVAGSVRDEGGNFRRRSEAESGFNEDPKENSRHESEESRAEEETCAICMDSFTDKKKLKCGHEFCGKCLRMSMESMGSICPVCKAVFGRLMGNQPDGTMKTKKSSFSLPGYKHCGTIEIFYNIPSGLQTKKHPNPGKYFHGTTRHAYLPDNHEGNEVLALLQRAFDQKLIFTVGTSTTSGMENAVTWNDIHHKTNTSGGPQSYGYPDPDYLKRVKDELKAKGIE